MKAFAWLGILLIATCIALLAIPPKPDEPEAETDVAVQTGKIVKTTLHRYVMAYGVVEPEPVINGKPAASSKIAVPIAGILTKVFCQEGQTVQPGQILFQLDSRAADVLVAKAEVTVEFARKNFSRKQQLHETDNISRKLYDEAEQLLQTAQKDLATVRAQRELLQIHAPLAGTIVAIHFHVGETVGLNTVLADLIDLDRLDIALKIPSQEAASVRLGQAVEFTPGNLHDQSAPIGEVIFIAPQIDPLTDTVLVRASIKNGSALRPGQFISARIDVESLADRLVVPVESVVHKASGSVIAVVEGDTARQITVTAGLRDGDSVEIAGNGIQEGMTVVTQGAYGLPAETRIRVVE